MSLRVAALGLSALALAACVLPPRDPPPQTPLDQKDAGLSVAPAPQIADNWWRAYHDPQFDALIERSLAGNPTLAEAIARLHAAAATTAGAEAARYPDVTFDTQEVRQRFSGNDIIPPPFGRGVYWRGDLAANLSWDIDFWGRQAALVAQAQDRAAAAQLDIAAARLALTSTIAQAYADLDHAYILGDIADRTITQRQHVLDITRERVAGGLDTAVEQREAEGALAQAHVDSEQAANARAIAVHQLAQLAGLGADAYAGITRPRIAADAVLPLPSSLPADLLGRRPDILAARLRVDAALAGRKSAKAAFYPDISLTAFAGYAAIGVDQLFRYSSFNYGVGPALHLPLFDAGRLRAQYRAAGADIDAAVAQYDETLLQAVQQTADALSNVASLQQQRRDEQSALGDAAAAYDLAVERYRAGLTGYLTVLTAQTDLLTAQRAVADIAAAQFADRIRLLIAVGGSFDAGPAHTSQAVPSSENTP